MHNISKKRRQAEEKFLKSASNRLGRKTFYRWCIKIALRSLNFFLTATFLKRFGVRGALNLKVEEVEFVFCNLPRNFNGLRILLLTDFHADAIAGLCDRVLQKAGQQDYDYCILGGDYTFSRRQERAKDYSTVSNIGNELCKRSRVFGVLGNHDLYSVGEALESCGVEMLVNENACIEKGGEKLFICGVDDSHYYKADDFALADKGVGEDEFKIIVGHSPCRYKEAARKGYSLYLTGHTHGGQICLPGGFALATNMRAKRKMAKGKWEYDGMAGYTSRGVGVTNLGVRFFCKPELTVITLRRSS